MGAYTNIKGWIEIPELCSEQAYSVTKEHINIEIAERFGLSLDQAKLYNSGWVRQESQINGSLFIFYGAQIRTDAVSYIKNQVAEIAKLSEETDDYRVMTDGFFYLEEDGTYGHQPKQWKIDNGIFTEIEKQI